MSIKKVFSKSKPECKITFNIPEFVVPSDAKVYLAGDFNNWEEKSLRMKKNKDGFYSISITLPTNAQYQFKYNIDGQFWINDEAADGYVANNIDGDNSILCLY